MTNNYLKADNTRHDSRSYKWIVVALLWVVALLNYLDRQMLSTMASSMAVDIVELEQPRYFGMLMAVFLWVYGFASPLAGGIADRVSRKWIIVGSLFVWSAVTLSMGFCTSFNSIVILRAIMGISEALYMPAGLALITEYHTGKTRSLAVGIHMTGLYTGQALGGFGATVAEQLSWQTTFQGFGIIGVVYALLLIFVLKDKRTAAAGAVAEKMPVAIGLKKLFSTPAFWVLLFVFAIPSLPGWATKNWLPTLFSENLNMDMKYAGPLSTISIAISSFIGVILGGILSDRWSQRDIRGRVYTSALGLALTIPALVLVGLANSIVMIFGAAFVFGIGYGLFDANNMPILCQFVPNNLRSTAYGFMNMIGVFAGALVTQVMGNLQTDISLGKLFSILGAIVAVAFFLEIFFLRPKSRDMQQEEF